MHVHQLIKLQGKLIGLIRVTVDCHYPLSVFSLLARQFDTGQLIKISHHHKSCDAQMFLKTACG